MDKDIILAVVLDRAALGKLTKFVIEVTEKSIKCVNNDISISVYNRQTGRKRGLEQGMSSIGAGHLDTKRLEKWLEANGKDKNGIKVWKSSFKAGLNSKGDRVDNGYTEFKCQSTFHWLKENGFRILDLR